jgi:hypothetical protein
MQEILGERFTQPSDITKMLPGLEVPLPGQSENILETISQTCVGMESIKFTF